MNNRFALSEGQQLLQLYGLMAKEAFTAIRYLSAGRSSLYHENINPVLDNFSDDRLRENMTAIGQLSEAMHNLPVHADDRNDSACTLRCIERFIVLQPGLAERFGFPGLVRQIRELDSDIDNLMFEDKPL